MMDAYPTCRRTTSRQVRPDADGPHALPARTAGARLAERPERRCAARRPVARLLPAQPAAGLARGHRLGAREQCRPDHVVRAPDPFSPWPRGARRGRLLVRDGPAVAGRPRGGLHRVRRRTGGTAPSAHAGRWIADLDDLQPVVVAREPLHAGAHAMRDGRGSSTLPAAATARPAWGRWLRACPAAQRSGDPRAHRGRRVDQLPTC